MMPDHARALRTCAVLAILAVFPPLFGGLAMLHMGSPAMGAALLFSGFALAGIAFRAGRAFDRLRQRHAMRVAAMAMLLGCAIGSYPALAQPTDRTLARAGDWSAFVAMGQRGALICGMDITGPEGQHFAVKRIGADRHLTIHVSKPSWSIPPGTRVAATMALAGTSFSGAGTATASGNTIEWTLRGDEIAAFERAFRAGQVMRLSFAQGSETPWIISLRGTSAMTSAFAGCVRAMDRLGAPAAPSQPFTPQPGATLPNGAPMPTGPERHT